MRNFMAMSFIIMSVLCFTGNGMTAEKTGNSYIYKFIEAESLPDLDSRSIRTSDFVSYLNGCSGGKVVLFWKEGRESGTYNLNELPDGTYYVFVRQLSWPAPQASVELIVNGNSLGLTDFAKKNNVIDWCKRLGPLVKSGSCSLTLKAAAGQIQAPYIDLILITSDPDYTPINEYKDYVSFTRRDLGMSILPFTAYGYGDTASLKINLFSKSEITMPAVLDTTISTKNNNDRRNIKTDVRIAPGANSFPFPANNLYNDTYMARFSLWDEDGALLASGEQVLDQTSFPLKITARRFIFSNLGNETVHVSLSPATASAVKSYMFSIEDESGKIEIGPTESSSPQFTYDSSLLGIGRHTICVSLLDKEKNSIDKGVISTVKVNAPSPVWPKLEPIREVAVKGNLLLVNGKPFSPRKLYHVSPRYSELREAAQIRGYNTFDCWGMPEGIEKSLDTAAQSNCYGYAILFDPVFYKDKKGWGQGWNLELLAETVQKLKSHPALLLWELIDEPDHCLIKPEFVLAAYDVIKKNDPNHPVLVNLGNKDYPKNFERYFQAVNCMDIFSFDTYPIPTDPQFSLWAERIDLMARIAGGKKPLSAVLQGYVDPACPRMPVPAELRCMAYLCINRGVTIFPTFSLSPATIPGMTLRNDPFLYDYTSVLNAELETLKDVIFSPANAYSGSFLCRSSDESPWNRICQWFGGGSDSSKTLDVSVRHTHDATWIIAVNASAQPISAKFATPVTNASNAAVIFEARNISVKDASFTDTFEPFAVHVYRFAK